MGGGRERRSLPHHRPGGQGLAGSLCSRASRERIAGEPEYAYPNEIALEADELWFKYEKDLPDVVKGLTLSLKKGEFLALLGGNGTGKTTSLKLLAGSQSPTGERFRASEAWGCCRRIPRLCL